MVAMLQSVGATALFRTNGPAAVGNAMPLEETIARNTDYRPVAK
jgi:hypothetical protein